MSKPMGNRIKNTFARLLSRRERKRMAINDILYEAGLEEADRRVQENLREVERLKPFEHQVHDSRPDRLKHFLDANRKLWTNEDRGIRSFQPIYIDDPIYRQLYLEEQIVPVYEHPLFQRLAHVKQLSFSSLSFPGATHSRLSHSLGAARNVEHALTRIFQKGFVYTASGVKIMSLTDEKKKELILKAKVSAMLHDLGHGPFGHGLDQYVTAISKERSPDKFYAVNYLKNYLAPVIATAGIDPQEVLKILDSNERTKLRGFDVLIAQLIDSPLDVDRMDYLVRDAHMTGLSIGTVNIDALIERIVPFEGEVHDPSGTTTQVLMAFDPSAIPYITHLLYAREGMYLNCYEHPTKLVAERMLAKAVHLFRQNNPTAALDDLVLTTDDSMLKMLMEFSDPDDTCNRYATALLRNLPFKEIFSIYPNKYPAYIAKKEEEKKRAELEKQKLNKSGENAVAANPDEHEEDEVPLKPADIIAHWEDESLLPKQRFLTTPATWEEKIAEDAALGDEAWKVLVTVPSGRIEPKFDDIRILKETDAGYRYQKLERKTGFWEGVLRHLAIERYNLRVFVSSDLSADKVEAVHRAAKELLTAHE
jgi:HD superfamily phosphohydrolase